jgi:hypothetical protein
MSAAFATITSVGMVVAVTSGAYAKAPGKAQGTAHCHIFSGSGTLTPGLTPSGASGGVKIHFTASLRNPTGAPCADSSVTSPKGVTITGGSVTASGTYSAVPVTGHGSSCANFDGADVVTKITVTIKWTTHGPAIADTKIVYTHNPSTVSGTSTDTVTLAAPPVPGSAVKHGSFAGSSPPNTTQIATNLPSPGPPCKAGPYSTFTITGGSVSV